MALATARPTGASVDGPYLPGIDGIDLGDDEVEGIEVPFMPGIDGMVLKEEDGDDEGVVLGAVEGLEELQPATARASRTAAPVAAAMRRGRVKQRREADIAGSLLIRCAARRRGR